MSPVRRVRRVIRRIDPWTVLKVSFVFNAIMALAFVLGSIIFWSVFVNAGVPDRLTEFAESLTLSFEVDGELYFRVVLFLSIIWSILMTGLATLGAVLYNLIADTVGGVEVVVLEEVIAPMAAPGGTAAVRPVRRPAARTRPATAKPASAQPTSPAPPKPASAPAAQQSATQQSATQQSGTQQSGTQQSGTQPSATEQAATPGSAGGNDTADGAKATAVSELPTSETRVAP